MTREHNEMIFGMQCYFSKLVEYSFYTNGLCESQYGFRQKRSTTNAVSDLYMNITNGLLKKECLLANFIDFSKASDTINHTVLFRKLPWYGIRGCALDWIKSYMNNRSMLVSSQGCLSYEVQLSQYGVPQGSVLGPLLFILYANDLSKCLRHSKSIFYADDTSLFLTDNTVSELTQKMNSDLQQVFKWCNTNSLSVNVIKTKCMLFGKNSGPHPDGNSTCVLANQPIGRVTTFKFLGITLDERFTWKPHIEALSSKISIGLYALRRVRDLVSVKAC